jgi:hypothetical protein
MKEYFNELHQLPFRTKKKLEEILDLENKTNVILQFWA